MESKSFVDGERDALCLCDTSSDQFRQKVIIGKEAHPLARMICDVQLDTSRLSANGI